MGAAAGAARSRPKRHPARRGRSNGLLRPLLPVESVLLAQWRFCGGATEYCTEYLDDVSETTGEDEVFRTQQQAQSDAIAEFDLQRPQWRDGVPLAASLEIGAECNPADTGKRPGQRAPS